MMKWLAQATGSRGNSKSGIPRYRDVEDNEADKNFCSLGQSDFYVMLHRIASRRNAVITLYVPMMMISRKLFWQVFYLALTSSAVFFWRTYASFFSLWLVLRRSEPFTFLALPTWSIGFKHTATKISNQYRCNEAASGSATPGFAGRSRYISRIQKEVMHFTCILPIFFISSK